VLFRLNERQAPNIRHIAFWSNPYVCEDFLKEMPEALRVEQVTVCSNYMSGPISPSLIKARVECISRNLRRLRTLKRFNFLTGFGITPGDGKRTDCGFAMQLRARFECKDALEDEGLEMGPFDAKTLTAVVRISPIEEEKGQIREVELRVASVYEDGFGDV